MLYVPPATFSFSGQSPNLPSYTIVPSDLFMVSMKSLVSGTSEYDLVSVSVLCWNDIRSSPLGSVADSPNLSHDMRRNGNRIESVNRCF